MIETNRNHLIVRGNFGHEYLSVACATMHKLIHQGYDSIVFDFTKLETAYAQDMLPFAFACRAKYASGIKTLLELPEDTKLKNLFINCNWAHLIDPLAYAETSRVRKNHIPAKIFKNADQQYELVNLFVEQMLRSIDDFSRDKIAPLEWSLNEIMDNALSHADSPVGGVLQMTVKSNGFVEFIVCDAGRSIPVTLRETHRDIQSDSEALDRAIREGITRNRTTNMGNGLFGSFRLAQVTGGKFYIYSNKASLSFSEKNGVHAKKQNVPYAGSVVVCNISTNNKNALEEALRFNNKPYVPSYSHADRYAEEKNVNLKMLEECKNFGSRELAKQTRLKIENILNSGSQSIVLDMEGVALISSSFADEVFGKLFLNLGPLTFMNKIKVVGASKLVSQLVDRAISQRIEI